MPALFLVFWILYDIIYLGEIMKKAIIGATIGFAVPHRYRYTDKFFTEKPYAKI